MGISVLAPETAAKIAAGEVIGRPADVARELIDNAIDAGASQIRIEVRGGGLELIRLSDNGCGIPAAEVATAFERHATSKIAEADDLFRIRTLGFRGEALPSIAAVAQVTMVTKALQESIGWYINVGGDRPMEQGPRPAQQGTTIAVRSLFQNVPARLKYLRAQSTESAQIAHVLSEYALAYPEIRFTMISDGRMGLQTDGTGRQQDAILKIYGLEVASAMLPVALDESPNLRVHGYVSELKVTRATRTYLSFFVNRRCVQSRMLAHAIEEAYHSLLPIGRHPIAVLDIEVPADELDVNVHPAKAEVRFLRDRELYGRIQRAVRLCLTERLSVSEMVNRPAAPIAEMQRLLQVVAGNTSLPNPVGGMSDSESSPEFPIERPPNNTPALRVLGQVGGMFIIAEGPNGVFLIDQHRAHERVLYERLNNERASTAVISQLLLSPLTLELNPRQQGVIAERLPDLSRLGFDLEPFGTQTFLLRAVPAMLAAAELAGSVKEILDQASDDGAHDGAGVSWEERLITTMACKGAIKSGQTLTLAEMRDLVGQLEATKIPPTCPHGGPVMVHLSQAQLERHFGRR